MITRKQYMNREATHAEYYGQFVTKTIIEFVRNIIGEAAILRSEDEHFNDIELSRWDRLHPLMVNLVGRKIAEADNGGVSLSDTVCVAKQAAAIIKSEAEK